MVALITGGSSGMGLEYARELASRGYDLILVSNQEEELKAASSELQSKYAVPVKTHFQDLAKNESADELYCWCISEGTIPDILINNAGMFFFKELHREDLDKVQAMLNLHITTVTRLCILFGEAMKERGFGYILNVSSMTAHIPAPGLAIYSSTKSYLRVFGRSLSYELRPYGVRMTTVCPAAIATPLYRIDEKWMRIGVKTGLIKTPKWLVKRALKAMFRGRRVVSPGFMNLWLPAMIALLPGSAIQRIWERLK